MVFVYFSRAFNKAIVTLFLSHIINKDNRKVTNSPSACAISTVAFNCHILSSASCAAADDFSPYSRAVSNAPSSRWQRPISWYSHVVSRADLLMGSLDVHESMAFWNSPMRAYTRPRLSWARDLASSRLLGGKANQRYP